MIMIVVTRVGVAAIVVTVFADVKVEVEKAGAELAVPVPVAGGVKTETADTYHDGHAQHWAGQAKNSDHGSADASHHGSGVTVADTRPDAGCWGSRTLDTRYSMLDVGC
jgi:hypothetical protein